MSNYVVKLDSTVLAQGSWIKALEKEANGFPYEMYTVFVQTAEDLMKIKNC